MEITLGHLLILAVVIVILVIYRKMDASNRSLAQVRRYADKAREDLDAVVVQKIQELKDLGIDMDVQRKMAEEILKRSQGIEEEVSSKLADADAIGTRIAEYDKVLDDLIQVTRRAEENIGRIKDESEFVDNVAKRIRSAEMRLTEQEGRIPELVQRFQEENADSLRAVQNTMMSDTAEKVGSLSDSAAAAAAKADEISRFMKTAEAENQRSADRVRMDIKNLSGELVEKVSIELSQIEKDYSLKLDEAARRGETLETAALSKLKDHIEGRLRSLSSELSGRIDSGKTEIEKKMNSFSVFVATARSEAENRLEKAAAENEEAVRGYEMNLKDRLDELEGSVYQSEKTVEEKISRVDSRLKEALDEYTAKIEGARAEGTKLGEDVLAQCGDIAEKNGETLREQISLLSGGIARAAELGRELSEKTKSLDAALRRFTMDYENRIAETGEALQQRVVGGLDARLAEYEKDITYRFSGIEDVFGDIQNLEKSLRDSMERTALKVREDFSVFGKDMQDKQLAHKAELDASTRELRATMDEVEAGLAELKSRAYENVSEKLKIFEDEFFQDLRARDEAIQEKFSAWQSGVDSSLDVLARDNEEKRARLEARYIESLKNRFSEFQTKMDTQMGGWQEDFGAFQRGLSDRMSFSDESLRGFRAEVDAQVKEARQAADSGLREELSRQNAVMAKELEKFTKEYEAKLRGLSGTLDEKQKDLTVLMDTVQSDVTVWQAGLTQKIKDSEADVEHRAGSLKADVSDTVRAAQEDLARQRGELRRIESEIAALDENLRKKADEAISGFESRYAEWSGRVMRETGEFENASDEKIRAFRASIQDTRQQFDALHQRLFGGIEDKAKLLSVNLAEIDRRQKGFIEQTKVFERADTLKTELETSLEELKADIARTASHRKEIEENDAQFQRIRKLGEDVSEKMSRFTADKRRIDTLEEDYNRLIVMSETVKQKIQNVAGFDEQLEAVQASFRTLTSLQSDVEARFERIEKKGKILDATAEGVERGQTALADMEKKLSMFRQQIDLIPENIDTLTKKIDGIKSSGDKVDTAIKQIASIDTLMKDLEKRTDKLQKVREWLAKTETRIVELSRDVNDRVKLFGNLLKEDSKAASGGRKTSKAPSLSSRDMVRKLAREGWKVEQIAANLKMSIGEVELVLELPPK